MIKDVMDVIQGVGPLWVPGQHDPLMRGQIGKMVSRVSRITFLIRAISS